MGEYSGWGAEPGEGFLDALLEGNLGFPQESVGLVHRSHVIGHHATVSAGGELGADYAHCWETKTPGVRARRGVGFGVFTVG